MPSLQPFPSSPDAAGAGSPSPAWADPDLASNPHQHAQKASKVRSMFGAIAGSYDLNNRVHSLWQDVRWRNFAVAKANVQPGEVVLDVACGTGDVTHTFLKTPAKAITGLDFTPAMLDLARVKLSRQPAVQQTQRVTYVEGDAQSLPFSDESVDVISIAWGIRNVADPHAALREFLRVLKPGGRLVILEFDRPRNPLVRWFNDFYCGQVMPRTATWISGDRSGAYKYLPKSVSTFLPRDAMESALREAGFARVESWALSLGICVCYRACKE